jgi:hypothetical protein
VEHFDGVLMRYAHLDGVLDRATSLRLQVGRSPIPELGNVEHGVEYCGRVAAALQDGKTQEKVYDVVWSGDRKPGPDGKVPPVGNTVDIQKATWKNTIGSPELITVWSDPDFDAKQSAFYYARVIEIPTPRWTAYDALRFHVAMTPDVPMTTQERAYTSPIWYTP